MAVDCSTVPGSTGTPAGTTDSSGPGGPGGQVANVLVGRRTRARGTGPWTGLDRADVQARLGELLTVPDLLTQGGLNLSGPAAFARSWIRRDPRAFAAFTLQLYDTGRSSIGDHEVEPAADACPVSDHRALRAEFGRAVPPSADWMVLSALRDAENAVFDYRGDPGDDISALSMPGTLVEWLEATERWSRVRDEVGPPFEQRLAHARSLVPSAATTVLVLVNAGLLLGAAADDSGAGRDADAGFGPSLAWFPYHWLVLESRIAEVAGGVRFTAWSSGARAPYRTVTVSTAAFRHHYYGAVLAD